MSRPTAPCSSSPLLRPPGEHLCGVEALVVLVGECPPDHLQHLLEGLPYEGVVDRGSVTQKQDCYLLAEVLVGDYRPSGGRGGTGYSCFVHKHLLMGHALGGYQPRRGFQLPRHKNCAG